MPIEIGENDPEMDYVFTGGAIEIFKDTSRKVTIRDIVDHHNVVFEPYNAAMVATILNSKADYWVKFTVINRKATSGWTIELFDFRIDDFELYVPNPYGGFEKFEGGDKNNFNKKIYKHKNFAFDVNLPRNKPNVIYLKVRSDGPVGIIGVIRNSKRFLGYAVSEYFLLALFYGVLISMVLYNISMFITVKDKAYLYYVFYLMSIIIYASTQDGTGFQYLWPEMPVLNQFLPDFSLLLVILFVILYCRAFLRTETESIWFDNMLVMWSFIRMGLYLVSFVHPVLYRLICPFTDLVIFLFTFAAGIEAVRRQKYKPAFLYVIAFGFFFLGYTIYVFDHLRFISPSIFYVYSLNFGVAMEAIIFSLALALRVKLLLKEKQDMQEQLIYHLKEKEQFRSKVNRDLEQKVLERTQKLDTFVFKASHDIKGPLRSIIGLTKVGAKDVEDPKAKEYFEHILKSTTRLDLLLADLISLTRIQQATLKEEEIDFKVLVEESINSFSHLELFHDVSVYIDINVQDPVKGDKSLYRSVIQNLVENGLKYSDPSKENSFFKVIIKSSGRKLSMVFEDNGLGVDSSLKDKIFEMFFKIDSTSEGSGLGLHIVKMALEKMGGKISLETAEGKGSIFTIEIPLIKQLDFA
ncbi:MAG: sensor histidine kinase [Sporocytophaga sp.]|uniref:sensor histidine kinase n=1 Tax=Sporocytophaga sp. TaxID=2231183 RepID=UPI001B2F703D|nr:sensor histidine kinase [Sporocytophaga sp.]MBO9703831.1 sensor histidine kinase [Sporocytophaga sp.]